MDLVIELESLALVIAIPCMMISDFVSICL